jgi:hypothetical protein
MEQNDSIKNLDVKNIFFKFRYLSGRASAAYAGASATYPGASATYTVASAKYWGSNENKAKLNIHKALAGSSLG